MLAVMVAAFDAVLKVVILRIMCIWDNKSHDLVKYHIPSQIGAYVYRN